MRGTGWLEDPFDPRAWDIDDLALASSNLPEASSLEPYITKIFDQRGTSSCVANALSAAIWIAEAQKGWLTEGPSRLFLYFLSRQMHGDQLIDAGTYISTATHAARKFGAPDEKFWPFEKSRINRSPTWDAYFSGSVRRNLEYYQIFDPGSMRVEAVKAAIASGYPVLFGTKLEKSFFDNHGSHVKYRPHEDNVRPGGHAMLIVGYDSNRFRVLNSWGDDWLDKGLCWFDESYITWDKTRSLTVVKGWDMLDMGVKAS